MNKIFAAIATVGFTAATVSASAQSWADEGQFAARAGIFLPFEENLRNLEDIWFAGGVDYIVPRGFIMKNAVTVISVDWLTYNSGSRNQAFPITFSQRIYTNATQGMYFQAGIGFTVLDFGFSKNVLSARGGVGLELGPTNFVEANIIWVDAPTAGSDVTGAIVQYGIKF